MKHKLAALLCLLVVSLAAAAQNPINADNKTFDSVTFPVFTLNAVPVPGLTVAVVGTPGQATWCYWAVANFQIGSVITSQPVCVTNAPNTLNSSNYVSIYPNSYPASATSVDILALPNFNTPTGACACAVATGLTSGGTTQQSNSTSSYSVSIISPQSFNLVIRNEVVGSGSAHLLLRNASTLTLIADLSTIGSGTITGATAGGGLVVTSTTLGLLTSCSTNQVLQWGGSSWACATIAGSGTVTGSGTNGIMPVWTGASSLGNSDIVNSVGASLAVGSTTPLTSNLAFELFAKPSGGCTGSGATFPIVNDQQGCTGVYGKTTGGASSTGFTAAGMFTNATAFGSSNNQIGVVGISIAAVNSTRQIGVYGECTESNTITLTNCSGVFAFGYGSNGGTLAHNDGLTAQSASGNSTTITQDASVHVLVPFPLLGTFTQHAGILVDAQTVGVPLQLATQAFAALPSCSSTYEGSFQSISDSTTNTWGATIAGSGADHVLGYCDGTNWTVAAK